MEALSAWWAGHGRAAADWLTASFRQHYEVGLGRATAALDAASAPGRAAVAESLGQRPLFHAPSLPAALGDALGAVGVRPEAVDMGGVLPTLVVAWLVGWLVVRRGWASTKQPPPTLRPGSWWLCRIAFLRCLGGIYATAFLVALHQNTALLGDEGLLPASSHMSQLRSNLRIGRDSTLADAWPAFMRAPGLLWFAAPGEEAAALTAFALVGLALSLPLLRGSGNTPVLVGLWLLYHSISAVGQRWYSFGWESQLLETGKLRNATSRRTTALTAPLCGRLPGHIPLPSALARSPTPTGTDVGRCDLGLPLADLPHHDRGRAHQDPWGSVLAGPHLHGLYVDLRNLHSLAQVPVCDSASLAAIPSLPILSRVSEWLVGWGLRRSLRDAAGAQPPRLVPAPQLEGFPHGRGRHESFRRVSASAPFALFTISKGSGCTGLSRRGCCCRGCRAGACWLAGRSNWPSRGR